MGKVVIGLLAGTLSVAVPLGVNDIQQAGVDVSSTRFVGHAVSLAPQRQRSLLEPTASARKRVTIAIRDGDVRDVLTFLAKRGGLNIIMGDGVRGKITLVLRDVSVATAIGTIVKVQGYAMSRHQNVTWIRHGGDK